MLLHMLVVPLTISCFLYDLLQLSIPEASSRCRYDWMKGALTEWAENVVRPSPLRILNASNHEEANDRTSPPASKPALV